LESGPVVPVCRSSRVSCGVGGIQDCAVYSRLQPWCYPIFSVFQDFSIFMDICQHYKLTSHNGNPISRAWTGNQ
ncbi:MAG: hypothetical protein KAJ92_03735, partial [Gammaproteobacteria bacterium]|nr:hypothetical protein [Gammaproteobacteria bacterium]